MSLPPFYARSGFTLIEMTIVIVILAILGLVTSYGLADSVKTFTVARQEADLAEETFIALERVVRELRHASSISVPQAGESSSKLSFTRSPAVCGACVDSSSAVSFFLEQETGKLWRESPETERKLLTDNVSSFDLTASSDPPEKRIYTITLTRKLNGSGMKNLLTLRVSARPNALRAQGWAEIFR